MAAAASGVANASPRTPNKAPSTSLVGLHHGRRQQHRARLDQRREQIVLQELHDRVEPGYP